MKWDRRQPAAGEDPQKQDSDDGSFFMRKTRWATMTRTQNPRFVSCSDRTFSHRGQNSKSAV